MTACIVCIVLPFGTLDRLTNTDESPKGQSAEQSEARLAVSKPISQHRPRQARQAQIDRHESTKGDFETQDAAKGKGITSQPGRRQSVQGCMPATHAYSSSIKGRHCPINVRRRGRLCTACRHVTCTRPLARRLQETRSTLPAARERLARSSSLQTADSHPQPGPSHSAGCIAADRPRRAVFHWPGQFFLYPSAAALLASFRWGRLCCQATPARVYSGEKKGTHASGTLPTA
jgi:hypothetical protein